MNNHYIIGVSRFFEAMRALDQSRSVSLLTVKTHPYGVFELRINPEAYHALKGITATYADVQRHVKECNDD
jgi:hypothetical protein